MKRSDWLTNNLIEIQRPVRQFSSGLIINCIREGLIEFERHRIRIDGISMHPATVSELMRDISPLEFERTFESDQDQIGKLCGIDMSVNSNIKQNLIYFTTEAGQVSMKEIKPS